MTDPRTHNTQCPHCGKSFEYQRHHAGFSSQGFMYCDQDATVLTWGAWDPRYRRLTQKFPWMLDSDERHVVEASTLPCPCGGRFGFANPPRCPLCNEELPSLVPNQIYYVIVGRRIDGDDIDVWLRG